MMWDCERGNYALMQTQIQKSKRYRGFWMRKQRHRTACYTKNTADFTYNENVVGKCEKRLLFFGICGKI